ncbi:MAG TPA: hypothetical protein VFO91_17825, partial [Anaerolineales bacterium]|nr:hypothetical protein [Anaerolineales bacterium]
MNTTESSTRKPGWLSLHRRLRLDHLSPPLRNYTRQVLGVALFACLIIFLSGLGLYPIETPIEIPERLSPIRTGVAVPFSLLFMLLVALGFVAGALIFASYQPGWRLPFLTRLTIGALTLAFPLSFLSDFLLVNETGMGPGLIPIGIIWLAIGCGAATILCAFISSSRAAQWTPRFATGSFLAMSLAFLMFKVWWDTLINMNQINPETIVFIHLPVVNIISYLTPFVWLVGVIFFWQAIAEVRIFSREIGLRIANRGNRFSWLLGVLFAVKFTWLAIGYWPVIRGTAAGPWLGSRQDGLIAWMLAALFAIAAGWWLTHTRTPVDTNSVIRTTTFFTVGFLLLFIAAFLLFIPATVILSLGLESMGLALGEISNALAGFGMGWTFLFAALLLPLGLVFLRWKRFRYLGPLFLLSGLWALPSILQVLVPGSNLSFEYLTFDTMLTITLFVLAILVWRGKQPREHLWIITLVLVVSTLTALAESLIPARYAFLGYA